MKPRHTIYPPLKHTLTFVTLANILIEPTDKTLLRGKYYYNLNKSLIIKLFSLVQMQLENISFELFTFCASFIRLAYLKRLLKLNL